MSRGRIVAVALFGASFVVLTLAVAVHPRPFAIDRSALRIAEDLRTPWLTSTLAVISTVGSSPWLVAVALIVGMAAVAFRRDPLPGAWLLGGYLGAVILYQSLKAALDRPRPTGGLVAATGSAFPSGHATQGIAFFGMLAAVLVALLPRRARAPAVVVVMVVGVLSGLSRWYLGVHWITDVAGGFLLGGAWLALILGIRTAVTGEKATSSVEARERDGGPPSGEPPPPALRRSGG